VIIEPKKRLGGCFVLHYTIYNSRIIICILDFTTSLTELQWYIYDEFDITIYATSMEQWLVLQYPKRKKDEDNEKKKCIYINYKAFFCLPSILFMSFSFFYFLFHVFIFFFQFLFLMKNTPCYKIFYVYINNHQRALTCQL
jgi:hypothetical protein